MCFLCIASQKQGWYNFSLNWSPYYGSLLGAFCLMWGRNSFPNLCHILPLCQCCENWNCKTDMFPRGYFSDNQGTPSEFLAYQFGQHRIFSCFEWECRLGTPQGWFQCPLYLRHRGVPSLGAAPCTEKGTRCVALDQSTESYCDSPDTAGGNTGESGEEPNVCGTAARLRVWLGCVMCEWCVWGWCGPSQQLCPTSHRCVHLVRKSVGVCLTQNGVWYSKVVMVCMCIWVCVSVCVCPCVSTYLYMFRLLAGRRRLHQ